MQYQVADTDLVTNKVMYLTNSLQGTNSVNAKPFVALFDKQTEDELKGKWLRFPWEQKEEAGDLKSDYLNRTYTQQNESRGNS